MKLIKLFAPIFAAAAVMAACDPVQEATNDNISVTPESIEFAESAAAVEGVTLTAGNVWVAKTDNDWITVEPASGTSTTGQEVKIYVTKNEGADRTGVVTFVCNNSLLTTASVSISQPGEQGDGITTVTCAEFLLLEDSETIVYRVTGQVTGSINATYGNFWVTDDGGTSQFQVYGATNWADWSDQVKKGGTVTVRGNRKTYIKNSGTTSEQTIIEMTNGVIESYTAGEADTPTDITDISVADFIKAAAGDTWYRLTGSVGEIKNTTYGNFYVQDGTGSVIVWGAENWDTYKADFATGDNVTVVGKRTDYAKGETVTPELTDGYIESHSKPVKQDVNTEAVADVLAGTAGSAVNLNNVTVVAVNTKGYLVTDGTDYIYVFEGADVAAASAAEGDKVNVAGTIGSKSGMTQITDPTTTVLSSGNSFNLPQIKDITAGFDSYSSTKVEYIQVDAELTVSGDYVNLVVDGASNLKGSISYAPESFDCKSYDGSRVLVKGWYLYTSSIYVTILLTEIGDSSTSFFTVSPLTIKAGCNATSATIDVKSNVAWTASCDNSAFTLDQTSGTGSATITVSFDANSAAEARTANITVSTEAAVGTATYTVVLTQAKYTDTGKAKFVKVTAEESDWSGKYLLVYEDDKVAFNGSLSADDHDNVISVDIQSGEIAGSEETLAATVELAAVSGGYSVQTASGKYLSGTADANKLNYGDSASANEVSYDATEKSAKLVSNTSVLRFNTTATAYNADGSVKQGNYRFRYYKAKTYSNQKAIQLYKLVEE